MKSSLLALVTAVLAAHTFGSTEPAGASDLQEKLVLFGHVDESEGLNINLFDKSRLEAEYLSVLRERDQRSYEYLFSAMETLHGGLRDLHESLQALQKLSDESLTGSVPVQDLLASIRAYNQSMSFLEDRITGLELFPFLKEDAKAELSGKINFGPLKEHYQQQLAARKNRVDRLHFRLALPDGVLHEQVGLDMKQLQGMQLLSAEKINEMQKQVVLKKVMSTRERNVIDQSINSFTRKALEDFVDVFGTSERYRTSSDKEGKANAAEALKDAFWARFYIRANYGIKIGSIPVNYQKHIFNADYLLSDVRVGSMTVWDENHLVRALNLATEAQATLFSKGAGWKSSSLRHLSVWLTGSRAAEVSKQFIIDLVKLDLEQEIALGKSGGLRQVRASYREHYFTSEYEKEFYQKKAAVVFGADDDDDLEADVGVIDPGTLKGAISLCISVLEQMEIRLEEGRKLQDSLMLLVSDNAVVTKRKKRATL